MRMPVKLHIYSEKENKVVASVTYFASNVGEAINRLHRECGQEIRFITDAEYSLRGPKAVDNPTG